MVFVLVRQYVPALALRLRLSLYNSELQDATRIELEALAPLGFTDRVLALVAVSDL